MSKVSKEKHKEKRTRLPAEYTEGSLHFKTGPGWKACHDSEIGLYTAETFLAGYYDLYEISEEIFSELKSKGMKRADTQALIATGRHLYNSVSDRNSSYDIALDENYASLCPWAEVQATGELWDKELTDLAVATFDSERQNREQRLKNSLKPCFNGMCFVYYYTRDELDTHTASVEMEKLNIESVRIWSHFCWVLNRDLTVNRKVADGYHELYKELKTHGVREIVGMSHYWFLPEERFGTNDCSLCYDRDTRPGSKYQLFLDLFEESWFLLASEFPEVNAWEIGNELNHKVFLKRIDGTDFSWKERIDIATDMMFRGARGVRRANPSAKVIMPGLAPVNRNSEGVFMGSIAAEYDGIIDSVKETYANIHSGEFGSTDPRDYFDALAWHPYYAKQESTGEWVFCEPDEEWVDLNRRIYQAAADAGDEGVECYLTEYGQSDWGSAEEDKKLVNFVKKGFSLIRKELPFVTTVHSYRFCDSMGYVGDFLDNYAFYHLENGHLSAKQRTYELQRQYGGKGKLSE